MKQNKYRVMAAALCAAFLLCGFSTTAYAGGGEEWEDCTGGPEWEGLAPVEPTPTPEPQPNPFTPDGQGTMVDKATDQDGKEFFTIMAADESVFYLVIDRQRETENVYFLNAVTVTDLMALAEADQESVPEPLPEPEPTPAPEPEQEPAPKKSGGAGMALLALAVLAIGGAGWYFKIYRPKQQDAEPGEDFDEAGEYGEDYDGAGEYGGDYDGSKEYGEDYGGGEYDAWDEAGEKEDSE